MLQSLAVYLKKRNLFPGYLIIGHPKSSLRKGKGGTVLSGERADYFLLLQEAAGPFSFPKLWVSSFIEYDNHYLNSL